MHNHKVHEIIAMYIWKYIGSETFYQEIILDSQNAAFYFFVVYTLVSDDYILCSPIVINKELVEIDYIFRKVKYNQELTDDIFKQAKLIDNEINQAYLRDNILK